MEVIGGQSVQADLILRRLSDEPSPELGGYNLHWGPSSGNYTSSVDVGSQTTYNVTGLTEGQTYYFAVTAYDNAGTLDSAPSNEVSTTITAPPPVAAFNAKPLNIQAPLPVDFTNLSTGSITSWSWNFGDGATSTVQNPSHTYDVPGTYSVSLTVTGPGGSDTAGPVSIDVCCTITLEELAVDFGTDGLWTYGSGGWSQQSTSDPIDLETWDNRLAVALGSGNGIYLFDGKYWTYLTSLDPTHMVAWNDKLVIGLAGAGLWTYDASGWTNLTPWDPERVVAWGDKLAVAFGSGNGLWYHDGAGWSSMTMWDPYEIVAWDNTLAVAFDAGRGLWRYDAETWTQLATWEPVQMTAWDTQLAVAFGSGRGLWRHDGAGWTSLTDWDPYDLEAWADKLVACFDAGRGLWEYSTGTWVQLTVSEPVDTMATATDLYIALGAGVGLYRYDGTTWSPLTSWSSEEMVPTSDP